LKQKYVWAPASSAGCPPLCRRHPLFIEAKPNPEIAESQEFALAARYDGLDYPGLPHRILTLGISRAKAGVSVG
jgi:hypothetical protein